MKYIYTTRQNYGNIIASMQTNAIAIGCSLRAEDDCVPTRRACRICAAYRCYTAPFASGYTHWQVVDRCALSRVEMLDIA